MALRRLPASDPVFEPHRLGPVRLYLDDLEQMVDLLEAAGADDDRADVSITLRAKLAPLSRPDPHWTVEASEVDDLANADDRELRWVTLRQRWPPLSVVLGATAARILTSPGLSHSSRDPAAPDRLRETVDQLLAVAARGRTPLSTHPRRVLTLAGNLANFTVWLAAVIAYPSAWALWVALGGGAVGLGSELWFQRRFGVAHIVPIRRREARDQGRHWRIVWTVGIATALLSGAVGALLGAALNR